MALWKVVYGASATERPLEPFVNILYVSGDVNVDLLTSGGGIPVPLRWFLPLLARLEERVADILIMDSSFFSAKQIGQLQNVAKDM